MPDNRGSKVLPLSENLNVFIFSFFRPHRTLAIVLESVASILRILLKRLKSKHQNQVLQSLASKITRHRRVLESV